MVKGWILEAVSNEIAGNAAHLESAKDVWLELENDFLTSKLSREEGKSTAQIYYHPHNIERMLVI